MLGKLVEELRSTRLTPGGATTDHEARGGKVVVECRYCGTSLDRDGGECPYCGPTETVRFEF